MNLHDRLLAAIEEVADVWLVSQLRDPRLNFADEHRLNVFIPDIHLVTGRRQFAFHTKHEDLLGAVARRLRSLKSELAQERLVVYQLGDLLDLWRESGSYDPKADVASAIEDAHPGLMEALYDPDLDAQFLLGNHDYDLCLFPNYDLWQRSFYPAPPVFALHGDVFDWVQDFPDQVKQFFVYLFSPVVKPGRAQLAAMRPLNQESGRRRGLRNAGAPGVAQLGRLARASEAAGCGRFNVQDANSAPEMLTFLDAARARRLQAGAQSGCSLTTAVIAHTHHARIAVHEDREELFALVDCGAWIENCVVADDPTPRPNAQIGAVGTNEIRLYQLAPRNPVREHPSGAPSSNSITAA